MILTIDLGNSVIKLALFLKGKKIAFQMLETKDIDFKSFILSFLYKANIRETQIKDAVLSSVVPELTNSMVEDLRTILGKDPYVISQKNNYGIKIGEGMKKEHIGTDLIVMCAYAYQKIRSELVIVSFGTATVLCHVTADGTFEHCIIAPGFKALAGTLYTNAAILPEFAPKKSKKILVSTTLEAMSVGVVDGFIGMVRYLIANMKGAVNKDMVIIGCGGNGKEVYKYIPELKAYDPDLVTAGLYYIYQNILKK